jgi:uncharacterized protein
MYERFGLVLMVTHACDLRCSYCYAGHKSADTMSIETGRAAIDRALQSVEPGGTLELGFFGGEPLLKSDLILNLLKHASCGCDRRNIALQPTLTTNGMHADGAAWEVMAWPGMEIGVSHDGLPEVHDRHRRRADGQPTSPRVLTTMTRLLEADRSVLAVMVVRPDSAASLADGIVFLQRQGVRHFAPSLDLWAQWSEDDLTALEESLIRCSTVWREGLPRSSIGWFDEKAAHLAGIPVGATARCGFGDGEVAVAPSGNLYPCERLIGDDGPDNPMRLPGHALWGDDFRPQRFPERSDASCSACDIRTQCSTTCRCSNYVRTGDVRRPDGLLCLLDRVCCREAVRVLQSLQSTSALPIVPPAETVGT